MAGVFRGREEGLERRKGLGVYVSTGSWVLGRTVYSKKEWNPSALYSLLHRQGKSPTALYSLCHHDGIFALLVLFLVWLCVMLDHPILIRHFPYIMRKMPPLLPCVAFVILRLSENVKQYMDVMVSTDKTRFQDSSQLLSSFDEVRFFGRH